MFLAYDYFLKRFVEIGNYNFLQTDIKKLYLPTHITTVDGQVCGVFLYSLKLNVCIILRNHLFPYNNSSRISLKNLNEIYKTNNFINPERVDKMLYFDTEKHRKRYFRNFNRLIKRSLQKMFFVSDSIYITKVEIFEVRE